MTLDALIGFYPGLSPQGVARFPEFYSADAYFKDPFNEVRGVAAIQRIFTHMFEQVGEPRFVVTGRVVERRRGDADLGIPFPRALVRPGRNAGHARRFAPASSPPTARSITTATTGIPARSCT